jgi:hypothetical protein
LCTRAVGGLAHYVEEEGVATTQISLIRMHTEAIKPPRALWVTFDLGRPLGVPNDADFQKRVLLSALKLFEESPGPVLRDFPEDAPANREADVVWACPVNLARKKVDLSDANALRAAFKRESVELRSWYDLALKNNQRTTVGVSGLEINRIVEFIGAFIDGVPANPREDISLSFALNFAVDDLKAFYYEAAAAQPGCKFCLFQCRKAVIDSGRWLLVTCYLLRNPAPGCRKRLILDAGFSILDARQTNRSRRITLSRIQYRESSFEYEESRKLAQYFL